MLIAQPVLNDIDIEEDPLTPTITTGAIHGYASFDGNNFHYLASAGYVGTDVVSYRVNDGTSDSNIVDINITVTNIAPVADDDDYEVHQGESITVDPLADDEDDDGDTFTPQIVTGATHGYASFDVAGLFSYTPVAGYVGIDTVTYSIYDGAEYSEPATITINVTNDAPVGATDDYTIPHDQTLDVQSLDGVLANDIDDDGDLTEAYLVDPPTHGNLTLDLDGGFVYTPSEHYVGSVSFTYYVTDGASPSTPITVTILVTNAATIAREDRYHVDATQPLIIDASWGVLSNDEDEDDTLTAAIVAGPAHASSFTLNADGSFDYTADGTFAGSDQFTYVATDALGGVQLATVYLTDGAVARDDGYVVNHGRVLTITADIGLVANDSYNDPTTTVFVVGAGPTHGTLALADDGSFTYTQNDPNYIGMDQFTYSLSGSSSPLVVATVKISIFDEKPIAVFDTYTVDLDTPLTVSAANGVLANDSDPEGDAMTVSLVQAPVNGTISLNSTGAFTYTPNAGFAGTEIVTYRVLDQNGNPGQETAVKFLVAQPAAPLTLSGRIRYDGVPIQKNVRGATVLLQTVQQGLARNSWRTIDYTTTNSTGNYTLTFDAPNRLSYRVLVMASNRSEAGTNRFVHVVSNNPIVWVSLTDHVFTRQRSLSGPIAANVVGFDFNIGTTLSSEKAFWTFDAAYTAVKAHAAITGVPAAATHVVIEYTLFTDATFTPTPSRIFLAPRYYKDWDTIGHEYGHIVQRVHGFFPFRVTSISECGGAFDHDPGMNLRLYGQEVLGNRPLDLERANKLAFSEGFANFFSIHAQEIDTSAPNVSCAAGASKDMLLDSLTVEDETVGRSVGEDDELTVMRILWDLLDNSDSPGDKGYDDVFLGFQGVFDLIANLRVPVGTVTLMALTLDQLFQNISSRFLNAAGFTAAAYGFRSKIGYIASLNNVAPWTGDDPVLPGLGGMYVGAENTDRWNSADADIPDFWFRIPSGETNVAAVAELQNAFSISVFNANYTTREFFAVITTSLTRDATNPNWARWTPTPAEWATISAVAGVKHISFAGLFVSPGYISNRFGRNRSPAR